MRRDGVARLGAWAVALTTGSLLVAGTTTILLYAAEHPGALPVHTVVSVLYDIPLTLAFAAVSATILFRLPAHPVGWLFGLVGLAVGVGFFANGYTAWNLPGVTWVLWLWTVLTGPTFFGLAMALLVFPSGQPPSSRWRWLVKLLWVYAGATVLVCAAAPWPREDEFLVIPVQERLGWPSQSPVGLDGQQWLADASMLVVPVGVVMLLPATLSLLRRWRRSRGDERQQIKWLGLAAVLAALEIAGGLIQTLTGNMPVDDPVSELVGNAIFLLVVAGLPVAVGLGIVRYRLYDIDVIISKTLVYGGLALCIGLGYVAAVVLAGELAARWAGSSTLLALAVTAVLAAAFHPLRAGLQAGADRLVFGRRAAPYELMTRFGHDLGQALPPREVLARVAETAGQAAHANAVRVRTTLPSGEPLTAYWPADAAPVSFDVVIPVLDEGEDIAEISVTGSGARPGDMALLRHTAAVSVVALRNLRLIAQLESLHQTIQQQNHEIIASRRRLVDAAQVERHRLERVVAQRLQPLLDAVRDALPELQRQLGAQEVSAVEGCRRLTGHATGLVEEVRLLSHGILPPLLLDHGLAPALRALLRRLDRPATLDVASEIDGARFPPPIETTVYLCCRAAASAAPAPGHLPISTALRLWRDNAALAFSVSHDTQHPWTDDLAALQDRVTTLGGELTVTPADHWSCLTGRLPLDPAVVHDTDPLNPGREGP
jgi:hypothetical protein